MFRILSTTSGPALLRCPSTLSCIRRSYRVAATTASKRVKRGQEKPHSETASTVEIKHLLDETEKPKKQSSRRKVRTRSDTDNAAAEAAKRDGESKGIKVGAAKTKKSKKSKSASTLEPLASGVRDEEGILRYLNAVYPETTRRRGQVADAKRVHVLSKSLCHDTLERMKPTLEKHVGCDIIDLNPGPGMWSSALHDFLKPRTHILMEPDPIYKPLLQPLLDAEGSTYKLVSKSGLVWNSLQETLSPELLPHQEAFKQGDPRLEEPNNSLLLVANLGYNPQKPYRGFASITNLVMYQLLSAARSHSLFHKYGLVRMLLWVDEEAKRTILPQNVLRRRKAAVEAELSCSDITEVVYSADAVGRMVRDHALDLESSFATLERMRKAGITTPLDRRGPLEIEATERMSKDQDSKFWLKKDFYKELDDHERRFAAGEFTMFMDTPGGRMAAEALEKLEGGPPPSIQSTEWARMMLLSNREKKAQESGKKFRSAEELQGLRERFASGELQRYPHSLETDRLRRWKFSISEHFTPEYRILEGLRARSVTAGKAENRIEALREEYDAIIAMRKQAANLERPAAEQLQHEATTRYNAMMEDVSTRTLPAPVAGMVQYMLDNRTAFHQDPPLLYWDRRRAEPLKARPEEFFPKADMALLDFEPRSMWPILRANFPANYDVLEYIVSTLLMLPSQSIRQGFNALAPGAFEHLIPECPSITDHKKGGSTYLDIMTVRCLTLEMFEEILEAWLKWPFRPSRYYILSKMGSDVYDPDEIDPE